MYGNHLAINHLVIFEQFDVQIAHTLLDQSTAKVGNLSIDRYRCLHLHAWHGHVPFSKFDFKNGTYDKIDLEALMDDRSVGASVSRWPTADVLH